MSAPVFMLAAAALVLAWVAVFRLPFQAPSRRHQIGMWLSDRLGLRADASFAIFGTLLYVVLGALVFTALALFGHLPAKPFTRLPPLVAIPAALIAILGTSSINALCMSVLYRFNPGADVPGEIVRIRWVSSILALPKPLRTVVAAVGAMTEELVFRGAVFLGLSAIGVPFWSAAGFSTLLFAIEQVLLVTTWMQALILGLSSCTLGFFGAILIADTGSVFPALVLHMSFASFYTNMSVASTVKMGARSRWSM